MKLYIIKVNGEWVKHPNGHVSRFDSHDMNVRMDALFQESNISNVGDEIQVFRVE